MSRVQWRHFQLNHQDKSFLKPSRKPRAFLKWAGGKASIAEKICRRLPKGKLLVEPFVGAGSIFLRSNYDQYILNDINPDLINLFQSVANDVDRYIEDTSKYFDGEHNNKETYYNIREQFNQSKDPYERSVLFLYLNRFCYNGLCRYNSKGIFNVPFGRYKRPYFPEAELRYFAKKAQKATFTCVDFEEVFQNLPDDAIVYCDPPYAPISPTASFTSYAKDGFSFEQQEKLAHVSAMAALQRRIPVMISNHDTPFTRDIYQDARLVFLKAARNISQKKDKRKKTKELLAIYYPDGINKPTAKK